MNVLIVGASGHNGGNVARRFIREGHTVRGLVRDPRRAVPGLHEVVKGDVVEGTGLHEALAGIAVAFYFVHSNDAADGRIDQRDLTAARNFVRAARRAGLRRAVFFTTLAPPEGVKAPAYQANRLQVERILADGIPGTTILRAGLVLGSGSRALIPYVRLVQRLPVIPLGPWRTNRIAVVDDDTVTDALVTAALDDELSNRVVEAPASAEPTHEQLIRAIAESLGLRRLIVPIPFRIASLEAALLSWSGGDTYSFSRYLLTVSRHDYTIDADRSQALSGIKPRDFRCALSEAVVAIRSQHRPPASGR